MLPARITSEFCLTNYNLMQKSTTMSALTLCLTSSNATLKQWHNMSGEFVTVW